MSVSSSSSPVTSSASPGRVIVKTVENITGRVIVVGDIHGCLHPLKALLRKADFRNKVTRASSLAEPSPAAALSNASNSDQAGEQDDLCVFVGDLVNKGPDSYEVVRYLRDIGAVGVLGNHDIKLIRLYEALKASGGDVKALGEKERTSSLLPLALDCPEDVYQFLSTLPHIVRLPQHRVIVVHAGLDPSIPLEAQDVEAVTRMRNLATMKQLAADAKPNKKKHKDKKSKSSSGAEDSAVDGSGELAAALDPPLSVSRHFATFERRHRGKKWAGVYNKKVRKDSQQVSENLQRSGTAVTGGNANSSNSSNSDSESEPDDNSQHAKVDAPSAGRVKGFLAECYANTTVVFGHDAKRRLQIYRHAIGIDSGCCYGGELTALLLPEREVISVPGWVPETTGVSLPSKV